MHDGNQIINRQDNSLIISVRVSPGARRSGVEGIWNETAVKIVLRAPAVDGKANEALVDFLSELCGVRKSAVSIVSGETNRCKRVRIVFSSESKAISGLDFWGHLIGL